MTLKYPKTPYWPWSPTIGRGDSVHPAPDRFVGVPVVATEKLDGGNTLLHGGQVYARSVAAPSDAKWMAMVKKHHAWKVTDPGVFLYGEDIYGIHSIEYAPVREDRTFYAFALTDGNGHFAPFDEIKALAANLDIATAPVLFEGCFESIDEICRFISCEQRKPSVLGGHREGVILRLKDGFPASDFASNVCKSVREGHIQTDENWRRNWKPCPLLKKRT